MPRRQRYGRAVSSEGLFVDTFAFGTAVEAGTGLALALMFAAWVVGGSSERLGRAIL